MIFLKREEGKMVLKLEKEKNRLFERIPCNCDVEVYNPVMYLKVSARAFNFSAEGLGILSDRAFALNDELEVKIRLSDKQSHVSQKAKVVWVKQEIPGLWRMGLKLLNLKLLNFAPLMEEKG